MDELDRLDGRESNASVVVAHRGRQYELPVASTLPWRKIFPLLDLQIALHSWGLTDLPMWKAMHLHLVWREANGLPSLEEAQRLSSLVDRFASELEYDLTQLTRNPFCLRELWRMREWRILLNLIDQLPSTSRLSAAMANDEELLRASIKANGGKMPTSKGPSLTEWTTTDTLLAQVANELKTLVALTIKVNGGTPGKIEGVPTPKSAWQKIEAEQRLSKHALLVGMLIPGGKPKLSE